MRRIWVVAMREYRANVRTKSFLIAIFLVPIFMFGGIGVITYMEHRGESGTKRVAVLDRSGSIFADLRAAAVERNKTGIFDKETGRQVESAYELVEIAPVAGRSDEQLLELSDRVRAEKYFAFVEISEDILDASESTGGTGIRYYTNQPAERGIPRWLLWRISEQVKAIRFDKAGIDRDLVGRALQPVSREDLGLLSRTESGEIKQAEEVDELASFAVPFGFLMMMFMCLMVTTQPLLHGVLEEKMQRIAEVVLGSIPPFHLMLGKLVGHLFVALTLILIYFAGAYFVANHVGKADLLELRLIGWFLVFMFFGIFMYGSLFLAVGACCNDVKEAQSLVMPIMFPMMIPMFMLVPIIQAPNGTLATVMSLIPIWTPLMMVMRLAMPIVVPAWQPLLAIAGCVAGALFCVWVAGRIFRIGLLMQGKPPKIGEMIRWAVRG
ncbi:MAG: ABC transporter permease [Phycisphaerae bacterium]|nr:ABC transporter permease [Phycisphaerae bacterium]